MPDILSVLLQRWRLIVLLTLAGTAAAFLASMLRPKLYVGVITALPVNTLVNDKARIFNQNIEALYSEIGTADELDKLEGTAQLDTVFRAVAVANNLPQHYNLDTTAADVWEKAVLQLRKNTEVSKTGYGELKIKVWDKNNETAALLANGLLQTINAIHERLQTENNRTILQKLKEAYAEKTVAEFETANQMIQFQNRPAKRTDSVMPTPGTSLGDAYTKQTERAEERKQYAKLIHEYELAVRTTPKALLVVEQAHPSPWYDRPKTSRDVLIAFLASLVFSLLLAVFVQSRNTRA